MYCTTGWVFLAFGLSQLASCFCYCYSYCFILYHVAGFYKPTIPQSLPSHFQDYSICNNARLEFSTNPYHRMFTVSRFILRIKHSIIAQILNQRLIRALECCFLIKVLHNSIFNYNKHP
jgi:hypothetical protein